MKKKKKIKCCDLITLYTYLNIHLRILNFVTSLYATQINLFHRRALAYLLFEFYLFLFFSFSYPFFLVVQFIVLLLGTLHHIVYKIQIHLITFTYM